MIYLKDKFKDNQIKMQRKARGLARAQVVLARELIKKQKKLHKISVKVQKGLIKQREAMKVHKTGKRINILPAIKRNRAKVERLKRNRRQKEVLKGKLLFAYTTMPARNFADLTAYSPKHSTIPGGKTNYSPKHSTIPDAQFAEKIVPSSRFSTVPKR